MAKKITTKRTAPEKRPRSLQFKGGWQYAPAPESTAPAQLKNQYDVLMLLYMMKMKMI